MVGNEGHGYHMNRREFIEKLQHALAGGLSSAQVADNVRYYQDYIESEIRKGRTEEEVLSQLGEPRLLAKSIIEANKRAGTNYGSNREYDEEVPDGASKERSGYGRNFENILMLPSWLVILIAAVFAIILIGLITSLLSIFAPVLIVGLGILLVVKIIQSNTK